MNNSQIQFNIIGDSLSYRSDSFGLRNLLGDRYSIQDDSIEGRNTLDWLNDINTPFKINPNIILIELGTNDAMTLSTSQFQQYTLELIDEIKKRGNPIIILTAVPLTEMTEIQEMIQTNNSFIKSLSNEYIIVDLESLFESEKNNLPLYPISDPIHPNPIGYKIIGEAYRKAILSIPIQ